MPNVTVPSTKRRLLPGRVERVLFTRLDSEGAAILAEVRQRLEQEEQRPLSLPFVIRRACQLALDEFRKLHETITAATISYFLAASTRPGITGRELAALLDMPKASTSRNYAILADNVTGGLGLLTQRENPHDRREKHIELTPRGKRVLQSIIAYLGKD